MKDILKSSTSVAAALANSEPCRDLFVSEGGAAEWFEDVHERAVAYASLKLHALSEPVDMVTIGMLIRKTEKIWKAIGEQVGEAIEICDSYVTDSYFRWHMNQLRDQWTSRATKRILMDATDAEIVNPSIITEKLEELVDASQENTLRDARQLMMQLATQLEKEHGMQLRGEAINTTWKKLDALTGGLKPEYWVIGARPSVGKTALALTLIRELALVQNLPVMFASAEMSTDAVMKRLISMLSGISFNSIPQAVGRPTMMVAINQIAGMPLYVEESASVEVICAKAKVAKRRWGIKALFVDYIQFLHSDECRAKRLDRRIEVGEISSQLKRLSNKLDIPVIALAQLSREHDKRGARPRMSDLKESGNIEQDADLVGLLYRDDEDDDSETDGNKTLTLDIAKQRNGRTGQINLSFDGARMQFSETYQ